MSKPAPPPATNILPESLDAEVALLGALIYDNACLRVIEALEPADFFEPFHGRVFGFIREQIGKGVLVAGASVHDRFANDPAYVELGGGAWVIGAVDVAMTGLVPAYVKVIRETSMRRGLIVIANTIKEIAVDTEIDAYTVVAESERMLTAHAQGSAPSSANMVDSRTAGEVFAQEIQERKLNGRPKGWMCGLVCFDRRMRGFQPGHLVVLGGRPSMGKTALARQAVFGAAERHPDVQHAFFCLEMSREEISARNLSFLSKRHASMANKPVEYTDLHEGMTDDQMRVVADLTWRLPKNLILDDTAHLSVSYVERRVRAMKRDGPVGLVVIDYLQIMERPHYSSGKNDAAILGEMTAALKRLARAEGVCILLLSQLSRKVEEREDKRPNMADLRESGAIEQDANAIFFPFREQYYLERSEPKEGTPERLVWEDAMKAAEDRMDVACAKWRGGRIGTDHQIYEAAFDLIMDIPDDKPAPALPALTYAGD